MFIIYLNEFARSASEIRSRLYDKTLITVEHLIYIWFDPNNINRNHWISEIYSFINSVGILKNTKKFPTKEFIYKSSYGDSQDTFTNTVFMTKFIRSICKKEKFVTNKTIEEIISAVDSVCVRYFGWLSDELSKTGFVDMDEVSSAINEILPKTGD